MEAIRQRNCWHGINKNDLKRGDIVWAETTGRYGIVTRVNEQGSVHYIGLTHGKEDWPLVSPGYEGKDNWRHFRKVKAHLCIED